MRRYSRAGGVARARARHSVSSTTHAARRHVTIFSAHGVRTHGALGARGLQQWRRRRQRPCAGAAPSAAVPGALRAAAVPAVLQTTAPDRWPRGSRAGASSSRIPSRRVRAGCAMGCAVPPTTRSARMLCRQARRRHPPASPPTAKLRPRRSAPLPRPPHHTVWPCQAVETARARIRAW